MKVEYTKTHKIIHIGFIKIKFGRKYKNNKIFIIDNNNVKKEVKKIEGLKIVFEGDNNTIVFHTPLIKLKDSKFTCGSNTRIEIKGSKYSANKLRIISHKENSICNIGKDFSCTDECIILCHAEPNLKIEIGDNCMVGSHVLIRASDAHTITDMDMGKILNYGKNVTIGNNVQLAYGVTVLKGVTIVDDCVIGTCSLVSKDCNTPNSIYAGVPAKMIKTGVKWKREAPSK